MKATLKRKQKNQEEKVIKTKTQAQKRLKKLRELIQKHDHCYYNLDQPEISDYDYDQLFQELIQLETQYPELKTINSPTQRVPGKALPYFEKAGHKKAMLSLQNTYNEQEIISFVEKTKETLKSPQVEFLLEPKLDGVALNLLYEKGQLTKALTRGDGQTGENVLANIKTIRSIPLSLPISHPNLEIRGEVILLKKDFQQINQEQEEQGLPHFANPRNMTAGSLRQLDPAITAKRPLKFFAHSPGFIQGNIKSQSTFLKQIKKWGLPALPVMNFKDFQREHIKNKNFVASALCKDQEDILKYWQCIEQIRQNLPYETDGVVIKVNAFADQESLGNVSRSPRWARAGKFAPEHGQTQVLDIFVQVGRTGVLTPVAHLQPLRLGGVKITHATLHNQSEINKKDIRVGDTVVVGRAGDVIPEVVKVDFSKRKKPLLSFKMPEKCPACGSVPQAEGDMVFCLNPLCSAVVLQSLIHFASKKAMNIESLGKKLIARLHEKKWVLQFSDIYKLSKEQLLSMEGMGEKSTQNILNSIEKSKKVYLPSFIFALGIRHIGEQTARSLSQFFTQKTNKDQDTEHTKPTKSTGSIEPAEAKRLSHTTGLGRQALNLLMQAEEEELKTIPDIGDIVARSLKKAFSKQAFREEIEQLFALGFHILIPTEMTALSAEESLLPEESSLQGKKDPFRGKKVFQKTGKLTGKTFVLTGALPKSRSEVEQRILSLGGQVRNTVNQKTDFLLRGEGMNRTSTKEKQARTHNVPILDWSTFQSMAYHTKE